MADQDLSLTFSVDSSAATDGIAQVNTALEQTATDAQAAGTAAAAAGQAITDGSTAAAPALSAVDQAAKQLNDSMDRLATAMANPNSGPRVLFKDAATAQMALTALQQAAASTGTSLDSLGVNVNNVKQQLLDAATKSATFTLELGKLRAAGLEGANQLQALQGKASSLSAMFLEMSRTGNATEQAVGKLAVGVGIGILAFDAAVAAGEKLGAMLAGLVDKYSAADQAAQAAAATADFMAIALNAAAKGQIAYGNSIPETVANYKLFAAEQSKSTGLLKDFETELKNIKPAADMTQVAAEMTTFGEALHVAFNRGTTDAALFLAQHKATFTQIENDWKTAGQIAPDAINQINIAMKQATAAQTLLSQQGAASVIESLAKITTARQTADASSATSAAHQQTIYEKQMQQLNQESLSEDAYSAKKKALVADMDAADQLSADKQAVADAEAELAQAKLQQQLGLSDGAMKNVAAATTTYTSAIAAGVQPSTALATAAGALQLAIEATGAAVPKLSKALIDDLINGQMKAAADQAGEVAKQTFAAANAMNAAAVAGGTFATVVKTLNGILPDLGKMAATSANALLSLGNAITSIATGGAVAPSGPVASGLPGQTGQGPSGASGSW
jgi:hypothetical protein